MTCVKCRVRPIWDGALCRRCDLATKVAESTPVLLIDVPWRPDWKDRREAS